jgi:CHAT domain-containing protein
MVEARLSEAAYAPLCTTSDLSPADRRLLLPLIARSGREPVDSWRRGLAFLLVGQREQAVASLEAAVRQRPRAARWWSDLAAAALTRGERDASALDLIHALEAADQALRLSPGLQEAMFNRALTLEKLALIQEAREAWMQCETAKDAIGWAAESRRRRALLDGPTEEALWQRDLPRWQMAAGRRDDTVIRQILHRHPQHSRLFLETDLPARWALAHERGDRTAETGALAFGLVSAGVLAEETPDGLPLAIFQAIERAGPEPRAFLARGHRKLGEALQHYGVSDDFVQLRRLLDEARPDLLRGGSPAVRLVDYYIAITWQYERNRSAAGERLGRLAGLEQEVQDAPYLLARVLGLQGVVHLGAGDPTQAMIVFRRAIALSERSGEPVYAAYLHCSVARILDKLGDDAQAWQNRLPALRQRFGLVDRRRIYTIEVNSAEAALDLAKPYAALHFLNELIRSLQTYDPQGIAPSALLRRGRIHLALGEDERAAGDVRAARASLDRLADPGLRERIGADAEVVAAGLGLRADPRQAAARLTAVIARFMATDYRLELAELVRWRARAWQEAGETELAARDYETAVEVLEDRRSRIESTALRESFATLARSTMDEAVAFAAFRERDQEKAFDLSERARARLLLDQLAPDGAGTPLVLSDVRERLQPGVALLGYWVLPDRLVSWAVYGRRLEMWSSPVAAEKLESEVRRFRQEVRASRPPAAGDALSEILLRQPMAALPRGTAIVVLPDRALHLVPFAALRNPHTGRFLIEEGELAVAPSATLFCEAVARDRRIPRGRILVAGDPSFSTVAFPDLPRLPVAAEEARRIARLWDGRSVLRVGPAVTLRRLTADLAAAEVFHFAGHARELSGSFTGSGLPLAVEDPDDPGLWTAEQIARSPLPRTRLVVLAGCRTAAGSRSTIEGPASLARAFFAAGVPSVVGSLWNVDDVPTAELLIRFHRRLAAGDTAAAALRRVQRELLQNPDASLRSPATWAAFQLFGGWSPRASDAPTTREGL